MDVTSYLLGKKSGGGSKPPVLQDKGVTITENTTTSITADTGYDGLNEVEVVTNVSSGDLSDYFEDTITAGDSYTPGFLKSIKKIKSPLTISGTSLMYALARFVGTEIPRISGDMSVVTNMKGMFVNLTKVKSLDLSYFDTSNATDMSDMFLDCRQLTDLDISSFNFEKATNVRNILYMNYASKLVNLNFGYNLGKGYSTAMSANYSYYELNLSKHTNLTHDSLMSVINGLYDIASLGVQPQKLVLGATNLAKLSQAEIDIATNKGWTVS